MSLPNHPPATGVQDMHLSTIHEDCSYCSLTGSQPPQPQQFANPIMAPYLPPLNTNFRKYTLVLDLDETLIHYVDTSFEEESNLSSQYCATNQQNDTGNGVGQFLIRPGAHRFLKEMSKYYEIVIFTAAMQDVSSPYRLTIDSMLTGFSISSTWSIASATDSIDNMPFQRASSS